MSADWLKMRIDLEEDPAVIAMAAALGGIDEQDVVGRLHRFWGWGNKQTTDGNAVGVTGAWLDRYVRTPGFAQAMVDVGWLEAKVVEGVSVLTIPRFDEHNSQSAKQRAVTAKRAARCRSKSSADGATDGNALTVTGSAPREEKRREEEEKNKLVGRSVEDLEEGVQGEEVHAGSGNREPAEVEFECLSRLKDKHLESPRDLCAIHRATHAEHPEIVPGDINGVLAVFGAAIRTRRKSTVSKSDFFRGIFRHRKLHTITGQEKADASEWLELHRSQLDELRADDHPVDPKWVPLCDEALCHST